MKYVALTCMVQPEADQYVSKCLELGTASFGRTTEEAFDNVADATQVYLNTLEDLGECRQVLKDKGLKIYSYEPAELEVRNARFPVGSVIRPQVMAIPPACA
jgi:predicted RNase H-like HicB family nuclease